MRINVERALSSLRCQHTLFGRVNAGAADGQDSSPESTWFFFLTPSFSYGILRAVRSSMNRPRSTIRPISSAMVMNSDGDMRPSLG